MVNLSDEVEDKVTGYNGIVISKHIFLYGVNTVSVQPKMDHYGILPESDNFTEDQLIIINANKKSVFIKEIKNNFQPIKNTDYVFGGHTDKEN